MELAAAVESAAAEVVANHAAAAALARRSAQAAAALDGRLAASEGDTPRRLAAALRTVLADAERFLKKTATRNKLQQALLAHKTAEHIGGLWSQLEALCGTLKLGISPDDSELAAATAQDAADLAVLVEQLVAATGTTQVVPSQQLETLLAINQHQGDLASALPEPLQAALAQLLSRVALDIIASAGRGLSAPQDWSVDPDDVDIFWLNKIGRGGFGEVFRGRWEGRDVAVKVLNGARGSQSMAAIEKEAAVWLPLHHPNVLRPWRVCINVDEPFIVMPLMRGDVMSFLATHQDAGIDVRTGFLLGIARGMQYLHERQPPIIHGDLKANNVLIDRRGEVLITDFGLALIKTSTSADTSRRGGALRWIAPEKYKRGYKLAPPYDVFSFAMTALHILTGQVPFSEETQDEVVAMWIRDGERPDRPDGVSDVLWSVICDCWIQDPARRPTFREIAQRLDGLPIAVVPLERSFTPAAAYPSYATSQSLGAQHPEENRLLTFEDSGLGNSLRSKRDIDYLLEIFPEWCARKGITADNYCDFKESFIDQNVPTQVLEWSKEGRLIGLAMMENDIVGPLSPRISKLSHLQKLLLNQRYMTKIPESIGLLRRLQVLRVGPSRVCEIPESIGYLNKLTHLVLWHNRLITLPESIRNLERLRMIFLSSNDLPEFPSVILRLKKLEMVALSGNRITKLPSEPPDWRHVENLYLQQNELSKIPDWVVTLPRLERLELDDNHLVALPRLIGNLQCLVKLGLSNNRLKSLPDSIGELRKLRRLLLNNNLLSSLPDSIGDMQALAVLELNSNSIVELPASAARLTQLTVLTLERNNLTAFPDQIAHMTRLVKLNLSGNFIGEVPEWIGSLTMLAMLHLGKNRIARLPASIGALQRLTTLQLSQNWLGEVPDSVGELRRLTKLLLDNNQLKTLPRSLRRLENLTELQLDGNMATADELRASMQRD